MVRRQEIRREYGPRGRPTRSPLSAPSKIEPPPHSRSFPHFPTNVRPLPRSLASLHDRSSPFPSNILYYDTMAAPQTAALVNLGQNPAHQPAAAHGNEENIAPAPAQPTPADHNAIGGFGDQWLPLFRTALGAFNGPLSPTAEPRPSLVKLAETEVSPAPFGGPYGPLRRNRIEGNDELVFGTF
ncbi:hypothetical protein C8Q78DRAFT_571789 [Trametes maxima]|nr:hypothetical protein C8Q78DRAFT_571789 [Trametes maxima]